MENQNPKQKQRDALRDLCCEVYIELDSADDATRDMFDLWESLLSDDNYDEFDLEDVYESCSEAIQHLRYVRSKLRLFMKAGANSKNIQAIYTGEYFKQKVKQGGK